MRQTRECDVSMPGRPGADLVVVETDLALGSLERFFDRPSSSRDRDEVSQGRAAGREAEVVGELAVTDQRFPLPQAMSAAATNSAPPPRAMPASLIIVTGCRSRQG